MPIANIGGILPIKSFIDALIMYINILFMAQLAIRPHKHRSMPVLCGLTFIIVSMCCDTVFKLQCRAYTPELFSLTITVLK